MGEYSFEFVKGFIFIDNHQKLGKPVINNAVKDFTYVAI